MLSSQEEQQERRRVFAQDQSLRSSTFHQHALAEAETPRGRFSAIANAQVVGATAVPNYPAASAAHQIQLPDEPALGLDNPALDPGPLSPAQGFDLTSDAPTVSMSAGEQRNVRSLPFRRIK